jgi:hypothetical protein
VNRPLAIVVGCLLGCGDGASRSRHDAAVEDGPAIDADPSCGQWRREPVQVTDVSSLEAVPIHPERSARVLVTVQQCPGDLPATPELAFTLATESVQLTTRVWRHLPDCAAPEPVQRPVTLKFPYPGSWKFVVADSTTRTIAVSAAPGGACNPGSGPCQRDCDCAEGVCLSGTGFATEFTQCAVPCELDRDCGGDGTCVSAADGLAFACTGGAPECSSPTDCPTGFACQSGTCEPTFTLNSTSRHDCTCDTDCDPGLRCAFHDGVATGRCEALCLTQSDGFCQGAHTCGAGSVEPARSVCSWVGE